MSTDSYEFIPNNGPIQAFSEASLRTHLRDMCMWSQQEIDQAIRNANRNGEHRHVTPIGTTRIKSIY